jgi:hypothetical protein
MGIPTAAALFRGKMKAKMKRIRLQRRLKKWEQLSAERTFRDAKVRIRWDTGGYKCPGSYSR